MNIIIIILTLLCIILYLMWYLWFYKTKYNKLIPDIKFPYKLPKRKQYTVKKYQKCIQDAIIKDVDNFYELGEAALYSLTGGKRLRSILCLELGKHLDNRINVVPLALAIEYLHCASLALDDMPIFDNDDSRRGKESVHKKFGEAVAQLLILALIGQAYKNFYIQICELKGFRSEIEIGLIANMIYNKIANMMMMAVIGQHNDIKLINEKPSRDQLIELCRQKTASFFELATYCTFAICGKVDDLDEAANLGKDIGTCYQIYDDIVDLNNDKEKGKENINIASSDETWAKDTLMKTKKDIVKRLKTMNMYNDLWKEYIALWTKI